MDADQYLKLIETQIAESKENLKIAEKKYREEKSKHDSLIEFKNKYINWVTEGVKL